MPETQSAIAARFESTWYRAVRTEPLLGLALGASGGLVESAVLKTSPLSGTVLGMTFGFAFGLLLPDAPSVPGPG